MKRFIFISLIIILSSHFSYGQVNEKDSLALVDLYNSTDGPNWYNNNNWLTEPVKYWTGISVVNNRVVKIAIVGNDLTGSIPSSIGNLTELTSLSLNGTELNPNNLTGSIPNSVGNLTALTHLNLSNNKLTGEIPASIGNLSSLISLNLCGNNLTGEIPVTIGNLSSLMHLTLYNNNLTGDISSVIENLSELWSLTIFNNKLSGDSSIMINNLSKLSRVTLYNNLFNFGDLEPFGSLNLSRFLYSPQDTLALKAEIVGDSIRLTFDKASGTQTNYQWLKKNEAGYYVGITTTVVNSYKIHKSENIQNWRCRARNSLLTKLELIGLSPEGIEQPRDCWEVGQLTFCLSSGEWEKASGNNKIKTSNIISINDFLFFDGTMTIDTVALEIEATGEYYVDNIPLSEIFGVGKYTLAEGKFKLNLNGDEQKISNFLNSELSKTAIIFGTPVKIDDLHFFKRNDTIGINVNASVSVPLLSSGCGIPGIYNPKTDLKLKNFEITNKGILSAGFQVENFGLFSQGCLKNATLEYNWKKDILIGGAELSLPYFGGVGAGVKIEGGKVDSIAWKIDSDSPLIPIYATFSAKGFYGHVAGLNNYDKHDNPNLNKLDIKIGGIFTDKIAKQIYQLDMDGRIKLSGLLEASGKVQFLQPPVTNFPYQIQGDGKMTWNYPNKQLKFNFNGNFGTLNEKEWIGDAIGNISVDYRDEIPKLSAYFDGDFTLPRISDEWPLNMIAVTIGTTNRIFNDSPNLVHGIVYEFLTADDFFKIPYIIDITKERWMWGYIRFPSVSRIHIPIKDEKSGLITNNVSKTFTVPENNEFGIVEIKSKENPPSSSITSPSGKKYSASSSEDNVFYSESENKKDVFWSLLEAAPGDWTITLENPADTDSLFTHFKLQEKEFEFSMNQTGSTITINWDIAQVEEGQNVNIMLDDNNVDFDGFRITEGDATLGSLSFTLDESTPDCNYNLYAQLVDSFNVIQSYADEAIDNPLATLAPPENLSSEYNSETGEFDFAWIENPTSVITGYILSVTDELGNDSVYAILNRNQTNISLFIEDFETKSAKIEAYNQDWKIGCPTTSLKLLTSIDENLKIEEPDNKLNVFPNPTTGNLTMRYFVSEPSKCEIRIFDMQGRQIAQPLSGRQTAGFHQLEFRYKNLPNGLYIIKYVNNKQVYTSKSILNN